MLDQIEHITNLTIYHTLHGAEMQDLLKKNKDEAIFLIDDEDDQVDSDNEIDSSVIVISNGENIVPGEELKNSNATHENSLESIFENATDIWCGSESITSVDDSIISKVWKNRIEFDQIKRRVKDDCLTKADHSQLLEIYFEIRRIWIKDLKEKKLSSSERRDLFKIKEEIEDLKIKIENRISRNQINLI